MNKYTYGDKVFRTRRGHGPRKAEVIGLLRTAREEDAWMYYLDWSDGGFDEAWIEQRQLKIDPNPINVASCINRAALGINTYNFGNKVIATINGHVQRKAEVVGLRIPYLEDNEWSYYLKCTDGGYVWIDEKNLSFDKNTTTVIPEIVPTTTNLGEATNMTPNTEIEKHFLGNQNDFYGFDADTLEPISSTRPCFTSPETNDDADLRRRVAELESTINNATIERDSLLERLASRNANCIYFKINIKFNFFLICFF